MPVALLLRISALVAMAASAALFMHYVDPVEASFCGADSGCEEVRRSGIGYFFLPFLNLPLLGLLGYAGVLATSVRAPEEPLSGRLAVLGAVGGVVLLLLQAVWVGAFCSLCVTVDVAAMAAGVFGYLATRQPPAREWLRPAAWGALAAIAVIAAPAYAKLRPAPPVPDAVRALYQPGKINVVEFADFQCPFCRKLHPVVKEVLSSYPPDRVHLRRMNVPLPHHTHALGMAMAFVCADQQGKGSEAADLLVELEPSNEAAGEVVRRLGLDLHAFEACVDDPKTEARIESETEVLRQAGMLGLPTTYVGGKRFVGTVDVVALRDAFDGADRGETERGVPLPGFLAAVIALVLATVGLGRTTPGQRRSTAPPGDGSPPAAAPPGASS